MKIFVKVKSKAKKNSVKAIDIANYLVEVTEPPEKNKANIEVIKLLAKYFNTSFSKIILLKGQHSKKKIFAIQD